MKRILYYTDFSFVEEVCCQNSERNFVTLSSESDTFKNVFDEVRAFHKQYLGNKKICSVSLFFLRTQRILDAVHSVCDNFLAGIDIIPPKFIIVLLPFLRKLLTPLVQRVLEIFLNFLLYSLILQVESSFLKTPNFPTLCNFSDFGTFSLGL